jgi:ABC-2 type transport system ATP-binding protein
MIRTDRLTKKFRKIPAVEELTFEVPEGAIYALLGPNGAGKTTLMKTLLNIWRPDSGRAWLLGVDSRQIGPAVLQQIGYVSESQHMPDWMRVDEYLRYCRGFYPKWSDEVASSLVGMLRLPLERRLSELSRGVRLKAALVSVLAYRPRVLLLDEPFSGLDVLVRDEISETILTEATGLTVLLASHDLADLESFASHVGYLHEGRMLFSEEMPVLADRYRGVEVTLEGTDFHLPSDWPENWLNPEHAQRVVRFTDSRFDADRVRRYFPGARDIRTEPLSLRRIFVELARARRDAGHDLAHS